MSNKSSETQTQKCEIAYSHLSALSIEQELSNHPLFSHIFQMNKTWSKNYGCKLYIWSQKLSNLTQTDSDFFSKVNIKCAIR